jgi:E3 ubiquitin-protein ligase SIAH1
MTKTLNKSLSTVEQQTSTTSTTTRHPFNINPDFSPIYPVGSQTFIPTLPPVPTEALEIDMDALDVGRLLQCPICLDLCIPPIYQFNNCLHTICSECQSKVHLCPVCRGNGLEFSRNRVLESLYNATKFACKYKNQGCTEVVRGDKFSDHVQYCQNK